MIAVTVYASWWGPQTDATLSDLLAVVGEVTVRRLTDEVRDELAYPRHVPLIVTVGDLTWAGYRPDHIHALEADHA